MVVSSVLGDVRYVQPSPACYAPTVTAYDTVTEIQTETETAYNTVVEEVVQTETEYVTETNTATETEFVTETEVNTNTEIELVRISKDIYIVFLIATLEILKGEKRRSDYSSTTRGGIEAYNECR